MKMGNLDKLKKIGKIGAGLGSIFAKGKVKSVLDLVKLSIGDADDPRNENGLRDMAQVVDVHTDVLTDHEARLNKLEQIHGKK